MHIKSGNLHRRPESDTQSDTIHDDTLRTTTVLSRRPHRLSLRPTLGLEVGRVISTLTCTLRSILAINVLTYGYTAGFCPSASYCGLSLIAKT
jgi:hypothetical protein